MTAPFAVAPSRRRTAPTTVPDAVRDAFDISGPVRVLRPAGSDSEHFCARRDDGARVVLRCELYDGRPLDAVARWCAALRDASLCVPRPLAHREGYVLDVDGTWTCWEALAGAVPEETTASATRAGETLGHVHRRQSDAPDSEPPPPLLAWVAEMHGTHRDRLDAMMSSGRRVIGHLDAHRGNFLDDGVRMWLIDWVDGGACPPALDAAVGGRTHGGGAGSFNLASSGVRRREGGRR